MNNLIQDENVERSIIIIRGQKVILDSDLAGLYGVEVKQLNQAVKRNVGKFPTDFMFQLTVAEKNEVVTNCDHLKKLKFSPHLPYAFTEHGSLMVASVLNSERAVFMSVAIIRTFIKLRNILMEHKELKRRLDELEKKYDKNFLVVFQAIKKLMEPPPRPKIEKPKGQMGFTT